MSNQFTVEVVTEIPATPVAGRLYLTKPTGSNRFHLGFLAQDGTTVVKSLQDSDINSAVQTAIDNLTIVADTADKLTTARTINGVPFDGTANITINATDAVSRVSTTEKGAANGVATLDAGSKIPTDQLPTYTVSVNGYSGIVNLLRGDVGLGNVDNTADSLKAVLSASKLTAARTINGVSFDGTSNITINAVDATARIAVSEKGVPNGVATLDANGLVPSGQLPSYVDDVLEYANLAALPATGEASKIYVTLDDNKQYRWSGSAYVIINAGDVLSVAGKKGVVTLVKGDVGLGNVDNTSDATKNVLSATKLTTSRSISATGDGSWTVNFDGSATATAAFTLATVNASPQTNAFVKVTVNGKGLVTSTSAVGAADITTALGFTPLNKAGDTASGNLSISKNTPVFGLDTIADTTQAIIDYRYNGSTRWTVGKRNDAESGSNAGSSFDIRRYSDVGSYVDTPLSINRSTGNVTVLKDLILGSTAQFVYSNNFGAISSSSPMTFVNNADTIWKKSAGAGGDTLMTLTSTGKFTLGTATPDANGAIATFAGRVVGSDAVNANEFATKNQLDAAIASAASGMQIVIVTAATQAMVKGRLYVVAYEAGPCTLTFPAAASLAPGDDFWILNVSSRIDHILANNGNLLQGANENQDFNMTAKTAQYKYINSTYGLYLMN